MFVDEAKIYARAGHGGAGCVAFHREAFVPKGGPSGGNGGAGGDVILEADHDMNNLIAQFYQPRLIAESGKAGQGKGKDGAAGRDKMVKVPCGTLVWRLPAPETPSVPPVAQSDAARKPLWRIAGAQRPLLKSSAGAKAVEIDVTQEAPPGIEPDAAPGGPGELIADLTAHGQRFVLCQGGRGGLGNRNFATATRQTPRFAQPGEPGGEGFFRLELRLLAEVGLTGYPNAGKSTLLSAISHARPKIAAYPFTTLHPQIGIVEYPDFFRLRVCDVPGLIEGAHRNVGLGHSFLRHIKRCKALVILLDMAGADGRQPWDDYAKLLRELELYDPALLEKNRLVVANKMDEPIAEKNLKTFKRKFKGARALPISAGFGDGLEAFKKAIRQAIERG